MVGESSSIQRSVVPGTVARFGWLVKSLTSLAGLLRQNICGQVAGRALHAVKYCLN